jgi:hypothetical protein
MALAKSFFCMSFGTQKEVWEVVTLSNIFSTPPLPPLGPVPSVGLEGPPLKLSLLLELVLPSFADSESSVSCRHEEEIQIKK